MYKLNELEVQELIIQSIEENAAYVPATSDIDELDFKIQTFEEAGVLTRDAGFVLKISGREFQVTIVRSK